jgi:hypothetical protein
MTTHSFRTLVRFLSSGLAWLALAACHGAPPPARPLPDTPLTTSREDQAAMARELIAFGNFIGPHVVGYSAARKLVVYPACAGSMGGDPGEGCRLMALDGAGKSVDLDVLVEWSYQWNAGGDEPSEQPSDRVREAIERVLVELDVARLPRRDWGTTSFRRDVPDFAHLEWNPRSHVITATRGSSITRTQVAWGDTGGPVAVYASSEAPVAVVELRYEGVDLDPFTQRAAPPDLLAYSSTETESVRNEGAVAVSQFAVVVRP